MKRTEVRSSWVRRIAVVLFVAAALLTVLFGFRTYHSFLLLRSAYAAGAPMTSSVRPWMTLSYVAVAYCTPEAILIERLGLPAGTDPKTSVKSLAERAGISPLDYTQRVQTRRVLPVAPWHGLADGRGRSGPAGWARC
jgi:hypothetical protein